jgi:hypothetical protein
LNRIQTDLYYLAISINVEKQTSLFPEEDILIMIPELILITFLKADNSTILSLSVLIFVAYILATSASSAHGLS